MWRIYVNYSLCICYVVWLAKAQIDPWYGKFCFEQAHKFVNNNDLVSAVAYFRTAVRHENSSELYWNDLGVTEMRIGEYIRARRRFVRSLSINPDFEAAKENLIDISAYMRGQGLSLETVDTILKRKMFSYRHHVDSVREISAAELETVSQQDFRNCTSSMTGILGESYFECESSRKKKLAIFSQPFIIRKFLPSDHSAISFFSLNNLISRYGHSRVDYYPQNMIEESSHPFFLSLEAAIRQLSAPKEVFPSVDVSETGTYVQMNLDLGTYRSLIQDSGLRIPFLFEDEKMWSNACFGSADSLLSHFYIRHHWKMLLIGAENASMFAHQDLLRASSYQVQLSGMKRWHLCAGDQSEYLYKPGDVNLFQPNYAIFPKVKQARCFEVIVEPGDLIYYPGDFWHQTLNQQTPSVSLSSTIVLPDDIKALSNELSKQCQTHNAHVEAEKQAGKIQSDTDKHYASMESQLCDVLENQCFLEWKSVFARY